MDNQVKKEIIDVLLKKQNEILTYKEAVSKLNFEIQSLCYKLSELSSGLSELYELAPDAMIDAYMRRYGVDSKQAFTKLLADLDKEKENQ